MNALIRSATALLVALVWSYFVLVVLARIFAAVQVPLAYFTFFGRGNIELALFLVQVSLHALPTVLMLAAGVVAVSRITPRHYGLRYPALPALAAFGIAILVLLAAYGGGMSGIAWWLAPSLLAPWLGLALGWYVVAKLAQFSANAA